MCSFTAEKYNKRILKQTISLLLHNIWRCEQGDKSQKGFESDHSDRKNRISVSVYG